MSAEYEESRNATPRDDAMINNDSSSNDDNTLEDLAGSANNSIIGKVKSHVSSILPSSLSKWFSHSTRSNNESLNGSFSAGTARRRRRLEIEDDDDECGDGYIADEGTLAREGNLTGWQYKDRKDSDEDTDVNNEDDVSSTLPAQRIHRITKTTGFLNQPPNKRSRISLDVTNVQEKPLQNQPLIASTPAMSSSHRKISTHSPTLGETMSASPSSQSLRRITKTNLYNQKTKAEQSIFLTANTAEQEYCQMKSDEVNFTYQSDFNENQWDNNTTLSSRRTLHLPSTSHDAKERCISMGFSNLKRHALGARDIKHAHTLHLTSNPSANIEIDTYGTDEDDVQHNQVREPERSPVAECIPIPKTRNNINGNTLSSIVGNKRQRLNGTDEAEESIAEGDSVSESSEGCIGNISELPNTLSQVQRKTGLFNMSNLNCHNGNSRTSSFGNGINFYSNLEGRKSLFSGGTRTAGSANALNNSTLSLTSLNRRQFNASIYGSTSALSDSRLLNTFSPFYKGKTTYGGAAAYKKYTCGSAAGTGNVRITPTLIRPTSSLSTLSSSNNSLIGNTGGTNITGGKGISGTENTSAISSTAKRILDLINDFATPLSEAKKMANTNFKTKPSLMPQTKPRLNEIDLQTSRALRLSQVRKPYTRPVVTLQPINRNTTLPPPVKELQVPSMSQLLQMKKMQSTTERSRQITMLNSCTSKRPIGISSEYTLPLAIDSNEGEKKNLQTQQKHTNKIKSKLRSTVRSSASKDVSNLDADELPEPVNLPDIAFPLMQSVPKFDIKLPKPQIVATAETAKPGFAKLANSPRKSNSPVVLDMPISAGSFSNNTISTAGAGDTTIVNSNNVKNITTGATTIKMNFIFSAPLAVQCVDAKASPQHNLTIPTKKYKFTSPIMVQSEACGIETNLQSDDPAPPELKSGSVLDALKEPFTITTNSNVTKGKTEDISFGDQFKKSASNKWECDSCLVHNSTTAEKCVACESQRKAVTFKPVIENATVTTPLIAKTSDFGTQFKKLPDEWVCEVCMIRNKEQAEKCVACEAARKGVSSINKTAVSMSMDASNSRQPNSFGAPFKLKVNTWECPSCLINNKLECIECVACQTKKPGAGNNSGLTTNNTVTTFKFGFSAANTTAPAQTNVPPDTGFKKLAAAQTSSKWECDACMTRNDTARTKCVCCEQTKPGAITLDIPSNGPKFTFGSAATSKYTFGFGPNTNETTKTELVVVSSSTSTTTQTTDVGNTKCFVMGSSPIATSLPSTSSGINFGIQPTKESLTPENTGNSTESKDIADGSSKQAATSQISGTGFKLGASDVAANQNVTPAPAVATGLAKPTNLDFGIPTTSQPVATAVNVAPIVKLSTPTTTSSTAISASGGIIAKQSDSSASFSQTPTTNTFTFGNGTITTTTQPFTSGFSFATPSKLVGTEARTTAFSFGVPSTQACTTSASSFTTTSTPLIKPLFSFGSSTKSTTTASSSSGTTTCSGITTSMANSTGVLNFGCDSAKLTSPAAKPIFGSIITSTTIAVSTSAATVSPSPATSTLLTTPSNIFGTFGGTTSAAKTTTTSATPTSVSATIPSVPNANIFGALSPNVVHTTSSESKTTESTTLNFGNSGNTTTTSSPAVSGTTPFVFGSSFPKATPSAENNNSTLSAPTSWPKAGFSFGVPSSGTGSSGTSSAQKPVFGSFSAVSPLAASGMSAPSSLFGNVGTGSNTSAVSATFGSVVTNAPAVSAGNMFGAGASTISATTQPTPNLFGNTPTAISTFGAPPSFGNTSNSTSNASTFGTGGITTYGSFGATTSSSIGDGAPAPKKSEPAFNFGGNAAQNTSSGGFKFGTSASAVAKPAFNFNASNTPTFNFTGSNNDATPGAPFQFSAGAVPASSNIFAPTPTASGVHGAMQARRKIRQPTRRLTPR